MAADLLRAAYTAFTRREWGACWKFANDILNDDPENVDALFFAGAASREVGNLGTALTFLRRACALEPARLNLWMHYGPTLHDLNRWEEAREVYHTVLSLDPQEASAMANIAAGYVQEGNPAQAVEWADKALAIAPQSNIAHTARGFGLLGLGRWAEGWEEYAWLYGHTLLERVYKPEGQDEPMWDGTPGKTVVLTMEQGIGDHIMLAQCIPQLVADCKQVIIDCEQRMAPVWRRMFPGVPVYPTLGTPKASWPATYEIDAHLPVTLLGRWYRKRHADFPRTAYLGPDPAMTQGWMEWLRQFPRPWLGLAWQGGLARSLRAFRSFTLADLEPVMPYGGTLFDMSYHDSAHEVATWNIDHRDHQIVKPPINTANFDSTIALAACLDEVVTCTTTLAHVCGALGRHAYVLTPKGPQWRYQHRIGSGLAWYPEHSVEIVRQEGDGWERAIAHVAGKMRGIARIAA